MYSGEKAQEVDFVNRASLSVALATSEAGDKTPALTQSQWFITKRDNNSPTSGKVLEKYTQIQQRTRCLRDRLFLLQPPC